MSSSVARTIYDGTDRQGRKGDVAIRGDRIAAVGVFETASVIKRVSFQSPTAQFKRGAEYLASFSLGLRTEVRSVSRRQSYPSPQAGKKGR